MTSKKKPFSWPQMAVLLMAAGVTLFTGVQLGTSWSAMVLLQSSFSGGSGALQALVLTFLPLALLVLSAVAFIRLLMTRSTLVAQIYLIGLFVLYSLIAGLGWHLTGQAAWLDLAWLMLLVALFFALGHQEGTQRTATEHMHVNG